MKISTVAVIGAGNMGRGIAQCFAEHDFTVILYAYDEAEQRTSHAYIKGILETQVTKGKITLERKAMTLSNIQSTTNLEDVKDADLVVETVVENVAIKQSVLRKLDAICRPDTIFTSNTSSINISHLAAVVSNPQRVCGMHFFYPPAMMPVVEMPVTPETSRKTAGIVKGVVQQMGKRAIEVKESPGFVFNRLMIPMINEAAYLVKEQVASVEDIDDMMKLAATHPIGPLALADIIGIDVCLHIMEVLYREFDDTKYRPCPLLRRMVQTGELGRKTGKGFYTYQT